MITMLDSSCRGQPDLTFISAAIPQRGVMPSAADMNADLLKFEIYILFLFN